MPPCQVFLLAVLFNFANTTPMENASTSLVASSLLANMTSVFHIPAGSIESRTSPPFRGFGTPR